MRKPFALAVAASLLALAACANNNGAYLKTVGGGFIFNYRLANAMLGILVVSERDLPEGGTIEVSLTDPAGGEPLMLAEEIPPGESQFDFRFEALTGIKKDADYTATIRLLDAAGKEVERIQRVYQSDIDQAATMPDKPLTVGPGYARNPQGAN